MGTYGRRFWDSTNYGRPSGPYSPYTPDELSGWEFEFSGETAGAIARATEALVRFQEQGVALTDTEPLARLLMRSEAVASSRIEGLSVSAKRLMEHEALEEIGVRARLDSTEAAVLANIRAMHDHVFSVGPGGPVTLETLQRVDADLLKGGPLEGMGGIVRAEQNWIGGSALDPVGAAYVPPAPEDVPRLLDDLVRFCNSSPLPAVARAAIAHAQFETVYPFADGNGRTGRALALMVLRSGGLVGGAVPPISMAVASDRGTYIDALTSMRCEDPDGLRRAQDRYVAYWCGACADACALAASFEERVAELRASWEQRVRPRATARATYSARTRSSTCSRSSSAPASRAATTRRRPGPGAPSPSGRSARVGRRLQDHAGAASGARLSALGSLKAQRASTRRITMDDGKATGDGRAAIGFEGGYTVFTGCGLAIRFRAPYSLRRYIRVKEWDRGYLVVDAEYAHSPEPVEEYIDLVPVLEDLYIDPADYLPRIREVVVDEG